MNALIRALVFLVLTTAAFLKAVAAASLIDVQLVVGELSLATLLVCRQKKDSLLIGIVCFGIFACVNGWKAFAGYSSCGCFGEVPVFPSVVLLLDLGILLLLLVCCFGRPKRTAMLPSWVAYCSASSILLVLAFSYWQYHHRPVTLSPRVVRAGRGSVGDAASRKITIRNNSNRTVRLLNSSPRCACKLVNDLPLEIDARSARDI